MNCIDHTLAKLNAIIHQIDVLIANSVSHTSASEALTKFREKFQDHITTIEKTKNTDLAVDACRGAQTDMERNHKYLGLLLRSSNVRNAFEFHAPLKWMARSLLGNNTRIIISSEWEFSPYTYRPHSWLPDFVLIGLPAAESSNALILPIAGHELGHHVWGKINGNKIFKNIIKNSIKDVFDEKRHLLDKSVEQKMDDEINNLDKIDPPFNYIYYVMHQCEEIFCDFIGLILFGKGYLHAFHYLLSPNPLDGNTAPVTALYPLREVRGAILKNVSTNKLSIKVPDSFCEDLEQSTKYFPDELYKMLLKQARIFIMNETSSFLKEQLFNQAKNRIDHQMPKEQLPDDDIACRISSSFQQTIPAENGQAIANIINAGWAERTSDRYINKDYLRPDKSDILNDLILKSIEVMEFEMETSSA